MTGPEAQNIEVSSDPVFPSVSSVISGRHLFVASDERTTTYYPDGSSVEFPAKDDKIDPSERGDK